MSVLAGLSGAARGFSNYVLPELLRRKRKEEADAEKKKRNEEILKAYNTLQNQGKPMPTGNIQEVGKWVEEQKALPEAEATLLNNDFPLTSVMEGRKKAEKTKRFNETIAKLPEDFRKTIEPFAPILEDDPDAVLKMYADYSKNTGKVDDESLKMLGMSKSQFSAIELANKLGGAEAGRSVAKNLGIKWEDESGKDKPVWVQKQDYIDNLTIDKKGNLIPWDSLDAATRRKLATVDVTEDNYTGAGKIKGMKISDFKSISTEITKPFVGFEAMFTPAGKAFIRWQSGEKPETDEEKQLDADLFQYFDKTFTKEGAVKIEAVRRRYDAIQGLVDLSDLREEAQQFYLNLKAKGVTAEQVEADYKAKVDAGQTVPFSEDEIKRIVARMKSDG